MKNIDKFWILGTVILVLSINLQAFKVINNTNKTLILI